MTQVELTPLYRLRYRADSTLDLGRVGTYLLTRYGNCGRAVFDGPGAMEATLDKKERVRFLRFLRRHHPPGGLTLDEGRRVYAHKD